MTSNNEQNQKTLDQIKIKTTPKSKNGNNKKEKIKNRNRFEGKAM